MALYTYKGINTSGKEIKATINSESISIAKQKIKSMGIMLITINEQKSGTEKIWNRRTGIWPTLWPWVRRLLSGSVRPGQEKQRP